MSTPFADLVAASKKAQDNADCDGWRDKLVGKVILNDDEESALGADEVCCITMQASDNADWMR